MEILDPISKKEVIDKFNKEKPSIEIFHKDYDDFDYFDIPSALVVALAVANALTFVHATWESVDWLVERVKKLASQASGESVPELSDRERILALLARAYSKDDSGMTAGQISSALMLDESVVIEKLREWERVSVVFCKYGDTWIFAAEELAR